MRSHLSTRSSASPDDVSFLRALPLYPCYASHKCVPLDTPPDTTANSPGAAYALVMEPPLDEELSARMAGVQPSPAVCPLTVLQHVPGARVWSCACARLHACAGKLSVAQPTVPLEDRLLSCCRRAHCLAAEAGKLAWHQCIQCDPGAGWCHGPGAGWCHGLGLVHPNTWTRCSVLQELLPHRDHLQMSIHLPFPPSLLCFHRGTLCTLIRGGKVYVPVSGLHFPPSWPAGLFEALPARARAALLDARPELMPLYATLNVATLTVATLLASVAVPLLPLLPQATKVREGLSFLVHVCAGNNCAVHAGARKQPLCTCAAFLAACIPCLLAPTPAAISDAQGSAPVCAGLCVVNKHHEDFFTSGHKEL